MVEIKFRLWDKKEKIMKKVRSIDFFEKDAIDENGFAYKLNNIKLMQYTGLKDKNGKEIYEGDIVKAKIFTTLKDGRTENYIDGNWIVAWHQDGCWILQHQDAYENVAIYSLIYGTEKLVVVGNIFENHNLL